MTKALIDPHEKERIAIAFKVKLDMWKGSRRRLGKDRNRKP